MAKKDPLTDVRRQRFQEYCRSRNWVNADGTWAKVWNLEEGKYKTVFKPQAIVFEDGTKLKMEL